MPTPPEPLRSVVDDAGIQSEKLVVAAAVERQVLYLLLTDQAGDVFIGDGDEVGMLGDGDALPQLSDAEGDVHFDARADDERNACSGLSLEAGFFHGDGVAADGKQRGVVTALDIGDQIAGRAGFRVLHFDGGGRNGGAGRTW